MDRSPRRRRPRTPQTTTPKAATSAADVTTASATPLSLDQPPFRELPRASSTGLSAFGAGVGGTSGGAGTLTFVPWPDEPIMTSGLFSRFLQFGTPVEVQSLAASDRLRRDGIRDGFFGESGGSGRRPHASSRADRDDPGWGFGSPIGRFALKGSGVLIAGSDDGTASIRLVVPGSARRARRAHRRCGRPRAAARRAPPPHRRVARRRAVSRSGRAAP